MAAADILLQFVPVNAPAGFQTVTPIDPKGGSGAFSVVFRAIHQKSGATVALKFITAEKDPYRLAAFQREGALLNSLLAHEPLFVNLVEPPGTHTVQLTIGAASLSLDFQYLAFEWLPLGDLASQCQPTSGYQDLLERLCLFKCACSAVTRLHFLGCIHRDLKPHNFFLESNRRVKLGDFGTCRSASNTTPSLMATYSTAVGDLRYSAPELIAGIGTDDPAMLRRGDGYALGAILFELITGQPLFVHTFGSLVQLYNFKAHIQKVPESRRLDAYHQFLTIGQPFRIPDLRAINPHIPRCVVPHLMSALEKLAHADYRRREQLGRIQRSLQICELVLRNEAKARKILWPDPSTRRQDSYV